MRVQTVSQHEEAVRAQTKARSWTPGFPRKTLADFGRKQRQLWSSAKILRVGPTHDDTVLDGVGDPSTNEDSSTELADGGGQASLLHSEGPRSDRGREGVGHIVSSDVCVARADQHIVYSVGPDQKQD